VHKPFLVCLKRPPPPPLVHKIWVREFFFIILHYKYPSYIHKKLDTTRSYYRKQNAADMYMQDVLQPKSVFFTVCMMSYTLFYINYLLQYCIQGRRNDVKARVADFRERTLLNWYILRDVCKTLGVELRLIMFSIDWMIGVWGVLFLKLDDCISCVFWSKFVKEFH
jgi:hypothetical protein